jgi:Polysaccharide pyruvyl transferase
VSEQNLWVETVKRNLPFDRRTHLNDISATPPWLRRPSSHIIQFYSSYRNIGNFLPVLGIQGMLGTPTDVWDIHRVPVDWDYVHAHYRVAIIGGAGLLHACFEPFWQDFDRQCKLPFAIWGIGVCLPANEAAQGVSKPVVTRVFGKALLANVRDRLTVSHYALGDATDIAVCPTVPYLHDWRAKSHPAPVQALADVDVLHSIHTTLASSDETQRITAAIEATGRTVQCVENLQRRRFGIDDALAFYATARLVVSTRLHGAIIAFGFDKPYVALSFDSKVKAFVDGYGGGWLCESIDELGPALARPTAAVGSQAAAEAARAFGRAARAALR